MKKLLHDMDYVDNFIDSILVFTDTWEQHLNVLRELFTRLRNTGILFKCLIAYPELDSLMHIIGHQRIQPDVEKVESFKNLTIPQTKNKFSHIWD